MKIKQTFEQGGGIFCLMPVFVPRRFSRAGFRLRLHPDDYYALGTKRGSIKERWFSSVIPAMNGPLAPADEGMSYVLPFDGNTAGKFTLREAVDVLGRDLVGDELMTRYGGWPMYSKFFDYEVPLFHHLHLGFDAAAAVRRLGKPEAYYFPPEMNNYAGTFLATYFGFDPDVSKEEVMERLMMYEKGDNRITELSRAYRIQLGTGWYTPPGVIHAPGSYLTYEPQWNSDVNSVYENIASGEVYDYDFLVEERRSALPQALFPSAGGVPEFGRPLCREVGGLRQRLYRGQGADRTARTEGRGERRRRLRLHHHSGTRQVRGLRCRGVRDAALRTAQQRRILRQRSRRQAGRGDRKPQPFPADGDSQALRPEPSRYAPNALGGR